MRVRLPPRPLGVNMTFMLKYSSMNNLLSSTQNLVKALQKSQDMVIMSYDALTSLLAMSRKMQMMEVKKLEAKLNVILKWEI